MELATFVETVRSLNQARPFQQFDIERIDGKVLRVIHPDAMAYNALLAVVLTSDGQAHHLDHTRVVRICKTDLPPAPGGPGLKDNGPLTTDN